MPFVSPEQVAEPLASNNVLIYDVRSHGYYEAGATRIQGSRRLEPNALRQLEQQLIEEQLPGPRQVYLYCTCIREATSSRVARELIKKGIPSAVIEGGLAAWKKAGLPMERVPTSEIVLLPVFES